MFIFEVDGNAIAFRQFYVVVIFFCPAIAIMWIMTGLTLALPLIASMSDSMPKSIRI